MSEIDQIKTEARQLLEEVNSGKYSNGSIYNFESTCESSFKNRLNKLKQKLISLQLTSASLAHRF